MWGLDSSASSLKKSLSFQSEECLESSDDEADSNGSREEGLECPICCECFNMVENVPYVLWCGHTLCKNCVLGLQWAVLNFPSQHFKVPFLISCPWCHLLSLRLVYKGNLKFPRKNFFLLGMVERVQFASSFGLQSGPVLYGGDIDDHPVDMNYFSLHKSMHFFIHFTSKFHLVPLLLLFIFCVVPGSVVILTIYLLLTVFFAVPSFLVLYFAYPTLRRLLRGITS